jgi:hypothetical protein
MADSGKTTDIPLHTVVERYITGGVTIRQAAYTTHVLITYPPTNRYRSKVLRNAPLLV